MAPWKGHRRDSWASNGNISVYIFSVLFAAWLGFQIWHGLGGPPAPTGLDPMVMAALGVAVTSKSVEKRAADDNLRERQAATEDKLAALEYEDRVKQRPAPKSGDDDESSD